MSQLHTWFGVRGHQLSSDVGGAGPAAAFSYLAHAPESRYIIGIEHR